MRCFVALCATCMLSCAGAPSLTFAASGACSEEHDGCVARCARLKDDHDCKMLCDYDTRRCNARQGDSQIGLGESSRRLGDHTALLVDLFGRKIAHSSSIRVEPKGDVVWRNGAHELAPGAGLAIEFELPDELRQVELALTHAPGGAKACFITVTVGDKTLVGRYSPPRHEKGRLKVESWELLPLLPDPPEDPEAPYVVKMFIFNNNAAGSLENYRLASIEIIYRALQETR